MSIKKQIKDATKPVKPKVDTTYKEQNYAPLNNQAAKTGTAALNAATNNAETAYQKAQQNNAANANKARTTNSTVTKQIGRSMRKSGYSLTNRNVAGAATARSAATINHAHSEANASAKLTRDTSASKAKQTVYKVKADIQAGNMQSDIARSTQLNKTRAQQAYQSAESKKSRNLTNALNKREDKLEKKKRKYDKTQRQLAAYTNTLETRYQSVKSLDKAIKKMKKNKKAANQKTKLAYLQALRAKLKQEKKDKSSGGGSGRSGRRYGGRGRRYGSSGSSSSSSGSNYTLGNSNTNKSGSKKRKVDQKDVTKLWANRGRYILQPSGKAQDKKTEATKKKQRGGSATSVRWRGATIRNASGKKK